MDWLRPAELGWAGLGWIRLGWAELGWAGLDLIGMSGLGLGWLRPAGLGWAGLRCVWLGWAGLGCAGSSRLGLGWAQAWMGAGGRGGAGPWGERVCDAKQRRMGSPAHSHRGNAIRYTMLNF